ncbi:hypothetical protein SCUP515_02141 [Seiridium cupressi]
MDRQQAAASKQASSRKPRIFDLDGAELRLPASTCKGDEAVGRGLGGHVPLPDGTHRVDAIDVFGDIGDLSRCLCPWRVCFSCQRAGQAGVKVPMYWEIQARRTTCRSGDRPRIAGIRGTPADERAGSGIASDVD